MRHEFTLVEVDYLQITIDRFKFYQSYLETACPDSNEKRMLFDKKEALYYLLKDFGLTEEQINEL